MATKNVAANTSRAAAKAAKATPKEVVKSQLGADEQVSIAIATIRKVNPRRYYPPLAALHHMQAAAQEARQKSKAEKADRDAVNQPPIGCPHVALLPFAAARPPRAHLHRPNHSHFTTPTTCTTAMRNAGEEGQGRRAQ